MLVQDIREISVFHFVLLVSWHKRTWLKMVIVWIEVNSNLLATKAEYFMVVL